MPLVSLIFGGEKFGNYNYFSFKMLPMLTCFNFYFDKYQ